MSPLSHCIARVAVAPVLRAADVRSEQVTQILLGATGRILQAERDWRRVALDADGYEGWVHRGYLREVDQPAASAWQAEADCVSLGALLAGNAGARRPAPLGARLVIDGREVRLPDGERLGIAEGRVLPRPEACAEAQSLEPWEWAARYFGGAPYLWGGITPAGVDCSGLVQAAFAMRGVSLPRDAWQQAGCGTEVAHAAIAPGDLLFFSETGDRVTHVAFAAPGDTLVHSTLSCGGFVREARAPGSRADGLMRQLVAVRRIG